MWWEILPRSAVNLRANSAGLVVAQVAGSPGCQELTEIVILFRGWTVFLFGHDPSRVKKPWKIAGHFDGRAW